MHNIDVSDWQSNLIELARLNGTNEKSLVFPKAIGKSEMEKIAQQLADVRKKSYVSRT
ncbi:hypothetical protein [Vibrio cholerae]|uniref:hypothetical protein n=1 Tax=Vibrio cholerae TaxID=666 RepID=UPI0013B470F2|nr:hypothetical protein [Vibrio cholerae]EII3728680.1 hypothetical protein [Vibrio cholerae]EMA3788848.1 hypothetical protein [Vibrio cholerae]HAS5424181.1 hypothetical protein [Vibrio cholerae]